MFNDIKRALEAAEQIISALSYEKDRSLKSAEYWQGELNRHIEEHPEESHQYYSDEVAREKLEYEYICDIEKLLRSKIKAAAQ